MKKLLVAAAVTGLVGTVNAQSAFEGFYGQVGVGYESVDLGISNDVVSSGEAYTFSIFDKEERRVYWDTGH